MSWKKMWLKAIAEMLFINSLKGWNHTLRRAFQSHLPCPFLIHDIFRKWRQGSVWWWGALRIAYKMENEWLLAHSLHKEIERLMFVSAHVKYQASSECQWCPDRTTVANNLTLLVICITFQNLSDTIKWVNLCYEHEWIDSKFRACCWVEPLRSGPFTTMCLVVFGVQCCLM